MSYYQDTNSKFKDVLEKMFPQKASSNIGMKMAEISSNMFLNDFLYNVLGETKHAAK